MDLDCNYHFTPAPAVGGEGKEIWGNIILLNSETYHPGMLISFWSMAFPPLERQLAEVNAHTNLCAAIQYHKPHPPFYKDPIQERNYLKNFLSL